MLTSKVFSGGLAEHWKFLILLNTPLILLFYSHSAIFRSHLQPQKQKIEAQYGCRSLFTYNFPHFRACGGTQDVPACYLQVNCVEHRRYRFLNISVASSLQQPARRRCLAACSPSVPTYGHAN